MCKQYSTCTKGRRSKAQGALGCSEFLFPCIFQGFFCYLGDIFCSLLPRKMGWNTHISQQLAYLVRHYCSNFFMQEKAVLGTGHSTDQARDPGPHSMEQQRTHLYFQGTSLGIICTVHNNWKPPTQPEEQRTQSSSPPGSVHTRTTIFTPKLSMKPGSLPTFPHSMPSLELLPA